EATDNVGAYTITPSLEVGANGYLASNYNITYTPGALTVGQANLEITADGEAKTYGATITGGAGKTAFTSNGLLNGNTLTSVTLTYSDGDEATDNVGAYTITPSLEVGANGYLASNYNITFTPGVLTVNPAPLTITADNQAKCENSNFTFAGTEFSVIGILNADGVSSVTLTSGASGTNGVHGLSPYTITPSAALGTGLTNYAITYNTGNFTVWQLPTAAFTFNDNTQCLIGHSFVVTNASSNGSGTINAYDWSSLNEDDGNTISGIGPHTLTYFTDGIGDKTVNLTVTDDNGCTNSTAYSNNVAVYGHPTAAFTTTESSIVANDYNICTGSVVNFNGSTSTAGAYPGSTLNSGLAAFQYKVANLILPGPPALANAGAGSNASLYSPTIDGTNSVVHDDFEYSLLVTNNWGCTNETSGGGNQHILVYPFPVPAISTPDIGAQGSYGPGVAVPVGTVGANGNGGQLLCHSKVIFDNTSTIPNGSIVSYTWNFGDGSPTVVTNDLSNVKHEFPVNYTINWFDAAFPNTRYPISMVAVSDLGCSTTVAINRDIKNGPDAVIGMNDPVSQNLVGNSFLFRNLSQNRHPSFITSSTWNWGDGTGTSNTTFIPKVYSTAGDYRVHVITYTGTGCTDTAYLDLSVFPTSAAAFTNNTNSCSDRTVTFTNTSVLASTYSWNFGDPASGVNNTSTSEHPTHEFSADGSYTVTLSVNSGGSSVSHAVVVATTPTPGIISSTTNVCSNEYTFTSNATGYNLTYAWTLSGGTGDPSTTSSIQRMYAGVGAETLDLVVTSNGVCSTSGLSSVPQLSFTSDATVPSPQAALSVSGDVCTTSRDITNSSTGGDSYRLILDGGTPSVALPGVNTLSGLSAGSHTVKIVASLAGDCYDTATATFIVAVPTPAFVATPASCGTTVAFNATSSTSTYGALTYAWDFNAAEGTGTGPTISYSFLSGGSKDVILTATAESGCTADITNAVTVSSTTGASASFTSAAMVSACTNGIDFTNTSGTGFTYSWDFGDGKSSNVYSPSKSYGSAGTYTVTLTVVDGACVSTASSTVVIPSTTGGPAASFYVVNNANTQPLSTNRFDFFNSSQHNGFGWMTSYSWDFGDGTTNTTNTFVYGKTYATEGDYEVTLTAVSSLGCTSTAKQLVHVTASATSSFTYVPNTCGSKDVAFTSTATSASTYYWSFGDGSHSTDANPTHTYSADGSYSVTLKVNNTTTSAAQVVNVVSNPVVGAITRTTNGCNNLYTFTNVSTGTSLTYVWTFSGGTGAASTTSTATRTYAAPDLGTTVDLAVSADGRCTVNATQLVFDADASLPGVVPALTVTAASNCGLTRTIDNTGSTGASSYEVKIDNGSYAVQSTFPYDVTLTAGSHTIYLKAINGSCEEVASEIVSVGSVTPSFTATSSACGASVTFTNTTTNTAGATPTYAWSSSNSPFTSTSTSPTYTFASAGTYSVTLEATLPNGCVSSVTNASVTANAGTGPVASFTSTMVVGGSCNTGVSFTNTSTGATTYVWSFGDGTVSVPSTTSTIFHAYAATGTFNVILTAYGAGGCSNATAATPVVVTATGYPVPEVSFSTDAATQCITGNRYDFFNRTQLNGWGWVPTYAWDFGDGTTNTVNTFAYGKTYAAPGTYTVRLTGTSNMGCSNYSEMTVTVLTVGACTPPFMRDRIDGIYNDGGSMEVATPTGATGIAKTDSDLSDEVILYPNPNNGNFKLGLKDIQSNKVEIVIIDMLGRSVYSNTFTLNGMKEIDLNDMNLAPGTYNLLLTGNNESSARKTFVVAK
ncbi:MAG: PKD domain-containing protein, partial [Bacteroidia bacterium]|nr:PKD domain-containing protein [Bacteroidia bacterium]